MCVCVCVCVCLCVCTLTLKHNNFAFMVTRFTNNQENKKACFGINDIIIVIVGSQTIVVNIRLPVVLQKTSSTSGPQQCTDARVVHAGRVTFSSGRSGFMTGVLSPSSASFNMHRGELINQSL